MRLFMNSACLALALALALLPGLALAEEDEESSEQAAEGEAQGSKGGEVELLDGKRPMPATSETPELEAVSSEPDPVLPGSSSTATASSGQEALRLVRRSLDRIADLQLRVASDDPEWDREATLAELAELRRALEVTLFELGRLTEGQDLRTWIESEGLLSVVGTEASVPVAAQEEDQEPAGLTTERFSAVLAGIRAASFTEGKMQILTQELESERVTSVQVQEIVELFSFSRDRVDALVFLHPRILDPENFDQLLAALKFESDRETVRSQLGLDG